jgi:uncharacterized membrane protein
VAFYDWLLALHVLSAITVIASLTALWILIIATRPAGQAITPESAMTYGRVGGPLVGIGMVGTVLLGIWLAIDAEGYQLWILASLILWAVAGWAGGQAGRAFQKDPVAGRQTGIRFQALTSLAVFVILVLMIWKPGA